MKEGTSMIDHTWIQKKIKDCQSDYLNDLARLIEIPSVKSNPMPGAPYGIEAKQSLLAVLDIAEQLGFKTYMVDDVVGYAVWQKEDRDHGEYIGVFGHMDVVEAGSGWNYPPFQLTITEDKAIGRGVLDNKGPSLAALYAGAIAYELGAIPPYPIRFVFGTDEESGSEDMAIYLSQEPAPQYGFTPDCKFPAVYGERGMLRVALKTTFQTSPKQLIKYIQGSFTKSAVPDEAEVELTDGTYYQAKGVRSASNAPELGDNAITLLANILAHDATLPDEYKAYFSWIYQAFHEQHDGSGLNLAYKDEASGTLQLTPYALTLEEDALVLFVTFRYPITLSESQLLETLQSELFPHTECIILDRFASTLFPKDHQLVTYMQEAYEQCTHLDGTPVTTTGATYARTIPHILAFGPSFPGQKGIAHNADEYMYLEDIWKNMEIYTYLFMLLGTDKVSRKIH